MRLAAALTVVVGVVVGYALLPALRPAPKATSATGALWEPASGTPSVSTGAPAVAVEESAGALLDYPQIPGRGGVSTAPPSPTIARPAPTASRTPKVRALLAAVGEGGIRRRPSRQRDGDLVLLHEGSPARAARRQPPGPVCGRRSGRTGAASGSASRRGSNAVVVHVIDWCGCPGGRVIDLHPGAFDDIAPLSAGVVPVRVSW